MIDTYITHLNQLYEKGAWFGDTYLEKLADVTEEEAFTRPAPGVHSIAELVAHVVYWRSPIIKRLSGNSGYDASVDDSANWPALDELRKAGWKKLLSDFDESQKKLLKLLPKATPALLSEEYTPGNSWRYATEGMIQHDIYHLGQLGLVKKMIRERN